MSHCPACVDGDGWDTLDECPGCGCEDRVTRLEAQLQAALDRETDLSHWLETMRADRNTLREDLRAVATALEWLHSFTQQFKGYHETRLHDEVVLARSRPGVRAVLETPFGRAPEDSGG